MQTMQTITDLAKFAEAKKKGAGIKLLRNMKNPKLRYKISKTRNRIFPWRLSKEGYGYWFDIFYERVYGTDIDRPS